MPKRLSQRVQDAFTDDGKVTDLNRTDAIDYLKDLRPIWHDVSVSLNRTVMLIFALAATFELFRYEKAVKLSIVGIEFQNLTTIELALPVLIAYLYLEVVILVKKFMDIQTLHSEVLKIAYPRVFDNDLDAYLNPQSRALLNSTPDSTPSISYPSDTAIDVVTGCISIGSMFLPAVFDVYAFWVLFHDRSYATPWLWASLGLTVALTAAGLLILFIDKTLNG
jgi:hypothetical protein